jgi:signal transduction histidine kinase
LAHHLQSADPANGRGFAHALRVSAVALGVERVSAWCFDEAGAFLQCHGLYTLSTASFSTPTEVLRCADVPSYIAGLRERRVVAVKDARTHRLTRELSAGYLEPHGISSLLDAPIIHAGSVVGVVCHEHVGEQRAFEQHEVDFASTVADILALLLEQTARAALERQLRVHEERHQRAMKLEATSRLARTAAHDFNNVLTSVLAYADQLLVTRDEAIRAKAQAIVEAAEMGARISRELLVLGRDAPSAQGPVDVQAVTKSIVPLLHARFGAAIDVDCRVVLDDTRVLADESQVERLLMNLCVNACEAMGHQGRLSILLRPPHSREGTPRGYVALEVRDSGPGLSSEAMAHLFEPYFTTKKTGTGLGLASVHGIVKQLKGRILADNHPEGGASFVVLLPRVA